MARTQTVSDDEIFAAARTVFERRGMHGFTLSDVASEVGLSRAAIILRFDSTQRLKVALMTRMVDGFIQELDVLPGSPSGDNLLEVAAFIGDHASNRDALPAFFADYAANMEDTELAALEKKRGEALHAIILNVMPQTSINREAAATAFGAHLTGTIMNLVAVEVTDTRTFIVHRTMDWLRLAGIAFNDAAAGEPDQARSRKAAVKTTKNRTEKRRNSR